MEEKAANSCLIVGLGNPGKKYEMTRHNMGFLAVEKLLDRLGGTWSSERAFMGKTAKASVEGRRVHFLLPTTYMNLSGGSVRRYMDYYQIPINQLLVVCDDVALPFGKFRAREKGSSGGHNGLKDIEAHLGTQDYQRLRIGIGSNQEERLETYVVARFNSYETTLLPTIQIEAANLMENWVKGGLKEVINDLAKQSQSQKKTETSEQNKK